MNLEEILRQATDAIAQATDAQGLEAVRLDYLGKTGQITVLMRTLGKLPGDERKVVGQAIGQAKQQVQGLLNQRREFLQNQQLEKELAAETIDITLPGRTGAKGAIHPITQTIEQIQSFFEQQGFAVNSTIEDDFADSSVIGCNPKLTSQLKSPLSTLTVKRIYAKDASMSHKIEGLVISKQASFTGLKGLMVQFLQSFFINEINSEMRPCGQLSAQIDTIDKNGKRLSVLGCSVLAPTVLKAQNIDTETYTAIAFAISVERLAMAQHEIDDKAVFFVNDLAFLNQFQRGFC